MLIASSKKVIDTILDEYGKENFKKYTDEISEYYYPQLLKDLDISYDKYDFVEADKNNTKQTYNVMKSLYLQGYDAMSDIVDRSIGYSYDDPTIVINPENILKEVETIKIYDKDKGYI
jgi:hypothetical protein